jgi:hypothetical protein
LRPILVGAATPSGRGKRSAAFARGALRRLITSRCDHPAARNARCSTGTVEPTGPLNAEQRAPQGQWLRLARTKVQPLVTGARCMDRPTEMPVVQPAGRCRTVSLDGAGLHRRAAACQGQAAEQRRPINGRLGRRHFQAPCALRRPAPTRRTDRHRRRSASAWPRRPPLRPRPRHSQHALVSRRRLLHLRRRHHVVRAGAREPSRARRPFGQC